MTQIKLNIKIIKSHQLEEAAHCHMSAFPNSFTTKLGISYVIKMLEWYIISEDRFLLGVVSGEKVVGYVGGAKGYGSTSGMLQYAYWQGFIAILSRPYLFLNLTLLSHIRLISRNIAKRLFISMEKSSLSAEKIQQESSNKISIGLVVLGVHQKFRRKGIGSMLLKAFNDNCLKIGCNKGHLTVKVSNIAAIEAYKKNSWKIIQSNKKFTYLEVEIC